jgi:hypothetical protein
LDKASHNSQAHIIAHDCMQNVSKKGDLYKC